MEVVPLKPKDESENEEQLKKVKDLILKAAEEQNTGVVMFTVRKDGAIATHASGMGPHELALCSVIFPTLVMGQIHAMQGSK